MDCILVRELYVVVLLTMVCHDVNMEPHLWTFGMLFMLNYKDPVCILYIWYLKISCFILCIQKS